MKQYLTQEQIEKATIEELQKNVKAIQEELDQLKDFLNEEGRNRFRELVHLKILSNMQINLLEFREMVHRGRKGRKDDEE